MDKMKLVVEEPGIKIFECNGYEIEERDYRTRGIKLHITSDNKYKPEIIAIKNSETLKIIDFELNITGRCVTEEEFKTILKEGQTALEVMKILKMKYVK